MERRSQAHAPAVAAAGKAAQLPKQTPPPPVDVDAEKELDEALGESFPASDPPAQVQPHPKQWVPNGEGRKGDEGQGRREK